MYEMIDGVLLYSSLDAMRQTSEDVDLNETIENIKSDLEVLILQKSAVIETGPLPSITGVPILFYQLFYNLINNSLKFSRVEENACIQISAEPLDKSALEGLQLNVNKDYFRIQLKDNGIGFSQGDAERIFQTFSRLNSKDKYEGTVLACPSVGG
jgi:light-regulated signal transduction histidine kinase (bacteriophytochrome)